MGHGEVVPPEIAKQLIGWKKHFNSYTTQGRFNTVLLSVGLTASIVLYFNMGKGKKEQKK